MYGIKMHFKIAEYEWREASLPVVRKLLRSFNFTMGVCTVMFALRIAMLLSLFSKVRALRAEVRVVGRGTTAWCMTQVCGATLCMHRL